MKQPQQAYEANLNVLEAGCDGRRDVESPKALTLRMSEDETLHGCASSSPGTTQLNGALDEEARARTHL